jgi:DNA (cytosine-5)-methyltransferase 1
MNPPRGLVVDLFAGGGGASEGIRIALGRDPDIAVNHDAEAVAMHTANHPKTRHYCGSVWDVEPLSIAKINTVDLLWLSPDCTHFSKAKGSKPREAKRRALAWVAVRWALTVRPKVIALENVEEFTTWGPLNADGLPCPRRKGATFKAFVTKLRKLGYAVEWRELRACAYGVPTTRKRLFLVARCDGRSIEWPSQTHGPGLLPYRTAAECIDWSIPTRSVFGRKRPLASKTMARIARGIRRFVLESDDVFVVDMPAMQAPTLIQTGYGERPGQAPRSLDLHAPLGTVVAGGCKFGLVSAFLAKHYGGNETPGSSLHAPMGTVTTQDHHALVACALGRSRRQEVQDLLGEQPIVSIHGRTYEIVNVGMRMLAPRELYRAQGFTDDYVIDPRVNGKPITQTAAIRMAGNSAPPGLVAAVVRANLSEMMREAA